MHPDPNCAALGRIVFNFRPSRQIEIVKQAGSATYVKKFECPVLEAYKAYDAIMSGRLDNKHRE